MSEKLENKNNEIEAKLKELEERRSQLEVDFSSLSTHNSSSYSGTDDSDEIDLREFWYAIWSGKWLIAAVTSVFATVSVLFALSLPNEYRSTALLAPASSGGASSLSKLAGQFGGLASLAGISLGGGGTDDKAAIAMKIIKTWGFLEKFIEDNEIKPEVYAAKGWNRSTNQLIFDPKIYDTENKKWVMDFGTKEDPSSWELYEKISNRISISQDKANGLITLTVEYYSPKLAKEWTDKLVKAINAHLREKDKLESQKSIDYLKQQINETSVTDMQSVFYKLIEEQTKTLMLAEVSDEYVFKTLSEAKIAEKSSKPKRAMVCALGTFIGGVLSVVFVFIRYFFSKSKSE